MTGARRTAASTACGLRTRAEAETLRPAHGRASGRWWKSSAARTNGSASRRRSSSAGAAKDALPELEKLARDRQNPHALDALFALHMLGGLTDDLVRGPAEHADPYCAPLGGALRRRQGRGDHAGGVGPEGTGRTRAASRSAHPASLPGQAPARGSRAAHRAGDDGARGRPDGSAHPADAVVGHREQGRDRSRCVAGALQRIRRPGT